MIEQFERNRLRSFVLCSVLLGIFAQGRGARGGTPAPQEATLQEGLNGYAGTSDTTIFEDSRDFSQGGHPYIYAGGTAFSHRRGLLRFGLDSIPSGATITSVTLELTVDQAGINSSNFDIYTLRRLTKDWGEGSVNEGMGVGGPADDGDATYNSNFHNASLWDAPGADAVTTPSASVQMPRINGGAGVFSAQQMIADVQQWLDNPGQNFGWLLTGDEAGPRTARRFDSSENFTAAERPRLKISYLAIPPAPFTEWFFAEGDTSEYETFIRLLNTNFPRTVKIDIIFFFKNASTYTYSVSIEKQQRVTLNANIILPAAGIEAQRFGMKLRSTNNLSFFTERSMYLLAGENRIRKQAGHSSVAASELATTSLFAEGSTTNGRKTQLELLNPNDTAAQLTIRWLLQSGNPVETTVICPAERRMTIDANDYVPEQDFSIRITATNSVPFLAERTMWQDYAVPSSTGNQTLEIVWSHNAVGSATASDTWYFAEGATHSTFETFFLMLNPLDHPVTADLTFMVEQDPPFQDIPPVVRRIVLPPNQRTTINAELQFPDILTDRTGFATMIHTAGNDEIVAERAMYFRRFDSVAILDGTVGGTVSMGATRTSTHWVMPEGAWGGPNHWETFVFLFNPNPEPMFIDRTFYFGSLFGFFSPLIIAPFSRRTLNLSPPERNLFSTTSFSTKYDSTSSLPFVAERAMYWRNADGVRLDGHASLGIPLD